MLRASTMSLEITIPFLLRTRRTPSGFEETDPPQICLSSVRVTFTVVAGVPGSFGAIQNTMTASTRNYDCPQRPPSGRPHVGHRLRRPFPRSQLRVENRVSVVSPVGALAGRSTHDAPSTSKPRRAMSQHRNRARRSTAEVGDLHERVSTPDQVVRVTAVRMPAKAFVPLVSCSPYGRQFSDGGSLRLLQQRTTASGCRRKGPTRQLRRPAGSARARRRSSMTDQQPERLRHRVVQDVPRHIGT